MERGEMPEIPLRENSLAKPEQNWWLDKEDKIFLLSILASLAVQFYVAPRTRSWVDVYYNREYLKYILQKGDYFTFWSSTVYNYPPIWAGILVVIQLFFNPPLNWKDPYFIIVTKALIVAANAITAILLYCFLKHRNKNRTALLASCLLLWNPHVIFVGAIHGMFDSIAILFLFGSLLLTEGGDFDKGALMAGLAISTKQYTVLVLPFLADAIYRRRGFREAIRFFTIAVSVLLVVSIPPLIYDAGAYIDALTFGVFDLQQYEIRQKPGSFWRIIRYLFDWSGVPVPVWLIKTQYVLFFAGMLSLLRVFDKLISSGKAGYSSFRILNDAILIPAIYFLVFCPTNHHQWFVFFAPFACLRFSYAGRKESWFGYATTVLPVLEFWVFASAKPFAHDDSEPLCTIFKEMRNMMNYIPHDFVVALRITSFFSMILFLFLVIRPYLEKRSKLAV